VEVVPAKQGSGSVKASRKRAPPTAEAGTEHGAGGLWTCIEAFSVERATLRGAACVSSHKDP
jgi:hypothetical protein